MRAKIILLSFAAFAMLGCGQEEQNPAITAETETEAAASIEVQAAEYEFSGIPETLPPAETTFAFENVGEEPHELSVALVTSDLSLDDLLKLPEEEVDQNIEDAGHVSAKPGGSREMVIDLEPGRYAYVCFVPDADGTPHAFLGMAGEFEVA